MSICNHAVHFIVMDYMNYTIFPPPLHLKELVQCFWSLESNQNEVTPEEYFLMADACVEIIFQYNGGFQTYAKQSARMRLQHSAHCKFVVEKELGFFGVRLYPHAASLLLEMPANEIVNLVFDFSSLFKQGGRDLIDQIFNSKNSNERIAYISNFLGKWTSSKKTDPINFFVNQTIVREGQVDISHQQRQSGLSVKQFERRFKSIAGFAPKYFARIARFQGTRQKYGSDRISTLTELAYACNYYDQSHFIKEFKEFAGVRPVHYFKFQEKKNIDSREVENIPSTKDDRSKYDGHLPCGWFI